MGHLSLRRPAVDRIRPWSARTAMSLVVGGFGAFVVAALLVHGGAPAWDEQAFRALNDVGSGLASWLTPLAKLFLPAGIAVVAVIAALFTLSRTRSLWPIAFAGGAAALGWLLANLAKHAADRPRPYTVVPGAVLRQEPAHATSFPSSHATVAMAVAIALVAFLPRWGAVVGVGYGVLIAWSRIYLGVHYPLDVLAGLGLGCAAGGMIVLLERAILPRTSVPDAALRSP